ncbi:methionyl-tRNA formyltransferase [Microbacterium sp. CJ88]|uniref:methionyl-tRNA formyltransferase n=1 Tax=Microbacterium sp. CJ88 TaxID=3445672 RepID=UPI003F657E8E
MRLVFAGTPEAAVPSLRALAASAHEVAGVVTRSDAPLGRKRVLTPSPVARVAVELGIPVVKADRLDAAATAAVHELAPDLGVIVAYGGLVREPLLSAPRHGWINLHFSLLPAWRGAAPVQRALIAGDAVTGASVFQLVPALDAGDVYAELEHPLDGSETAGDLLDALAVSGADLLVSVVDGIAAGTAHAVPQTGEPTLAPKLVLDDGRLRWDEPADAVLARLRGVTPEPGAWTTIGGERLKIHRAAASVADRQLSPGVIVADGREVLAGTGTAPIRIDTVQPAGRGAMPAADWWRGQRADELQAGS